MKWGGGMEGMLPMKWGETLQEGRRPFPASLAQWDTLPHHLGDFVIRIKTLLLEEIRRQGRARYCIVLGKIFDSLQSV